MKSYNVFLICLTVIVCVGLISSTLERILDKPYTFKIEMDNNTLQAIQAVNYTALGETKCQPVEIIYPSTYPSFVPGIYNWSNNIRWQYVNSSLVETYYPQQECSTCFTTKEESECVSNWSGYIRWGGNPCK